MIQALVYLDELDVRHSVELIEVIERLYPDEPKKIYAAIFGEVSSQVEGYFDEVHQFCAEDWEQDVRWRAGCLEWLQKKEEITCIVIPATRMGRMTAPVLAARLETGLVADVVEAANESGEIQMIRPAFEGKLMACIANQGEGPVMMTVRPGVFHYNGTHDRGTEVYVHHESPEERPKVRLLQKSESEGQSDIRDAKVLVSGGGGVIDNFGQLERLAKPLGAMVSSSRRLVDSGVTPRSIQVGQSGKIVSPKLYMALGIYGSLQHIEGLENVEHIISVNTNKNAPICSLSTIVVEGDAVEFIEKLTCKIEAAND